MSDPGATTAEILKGLTGFRQAEVLWRDLLERSAAAEQPPLLSRLADALIGGGQPPWRGRFSRQVRHTRCKMIDGFGYMPRGTNEALRHGIL